MFTGFLHSMSIITMAFNMLKDELIIIIFVPRLLQNLVMV